MATTTAMWSASHHLSRAVTGRRSPASRHTTAPVTRCVQSSSKDDVADVRLWAPERRSRREALLLASTVGASFLAPARSARATEASNLASLASQEPDAEIAVELWDEVVRLAKASGESATPTGGSWLYSRAECLGALRRWTDAERAYGEAADVLETALE